EGLHHLGITDRPVVDVGREMGGGGENAVVRNRGHVVIQRRVNIVQRSNGPLGYEPRSAPDWRRALRRPAPASFQLPQGGVKLAPLAAGEEAPLQGVLQTAVV